MKKYDILEWTEYFEKSKDVFDLKEDALESDSIVLYPGRFYILDYMSKTQERYNMRPVIISLGVSQKDPESFLCIDLSILPKKIRLMFVKIFFDIYEKEIEDNMDQCFLVKNADKQGWMKSFTYENICKAVPSIPVKYAVKRYKIKNTRKIYSLPFSKVYRVIGDYCDTNFYKNGNVGEVQKEFLMKMTR